ncbi:NUDIX domain-containing protein [Sagittula sp. NFXS13]|uniref:NUDIX domain-containing protein n=1 Tax=Sagittula sp. NFXS13 TaxID=2819095 RepID=UPI0032DE8931
MKSLFCFGTLRDAALRAIVLGRDVPVSHASLAGHEVIEVNGQPWPAMRVGPGTARGVLLQGLTANDHARLDFYTSGFDFDARPVTVQTETGPVETHAYFPEGQATEAALWSLDAWQVSWGEVSRIAAGEVMARFGKPGGESAATLLPFFRNRAWSQVIARKEPPRELRTTMSMKDDVEVLETLDGYDGFFRLQPFRLRYRRFDGSWGDELRRECFVAYDVALVLPYDPQTDKLLLTEQLRFGPIHRGDPAPWVLEPVAGMTDAGESPEEAARRETVEEAGLDLEALLPISAGYASPGYSTEFYHTFIGLCDLSEREAQSMAGLDAEHEDIRNHVLSFDAALHLIETGEINALPLQMMIFALGARRAELRKK